ncbi:MAG: type II secretion system protein, partial [Bacteriovorax sp.]|nr:type II secretion system protein [Bacteriovorax sp.]
MSFKNIRRSSWQVRCAHIKSNILAINKKDNRGFSLVELIIVFGLLGGVGLAIMNLTKQSTKSSTKYQFDSEIMLITNEINAIL